MTDKELVAYEDIYSEIRDTLLSSRHQAYNAVNFAMVQAYWQIGRIIVEHEQEGSLRSGYGKSVLQELSKRLTGEFGKGFSVRTLQQMKKFYVTFPNTNALRSQLTWTHYRLLLSVEDEQARRWYMDEAVASAWSSRQLERQISTMYYERLLASREKELVQSEATELMAPLMAQNFIKDPYVLEFLDLKNYPALRESDLEQALLDLKIGKLTHGDIGQMDSYIRMFDALYKNVDDNPTIGIILCSQKNEAIVKYSVLNDAKQIFASRYRLELPTAEELQHELESERKRIEEQDE